MQKNLGLFADQTCKSIPVNVLTEDQTPSKYLTTASEAKFEFDRNIGNKVVQREIFPLRIRLSLLEIEAADTSKKAAAAYLVSPDNTLTKCEALVKWDRLALLEVEAALDLEETISARDGSPRDSEARKIADEKVIYFQTKL